MTPEDLSYRSGARLLRDFRARRISPVTVMESALRRAEALRESCNPFTEIFAESAMEKARESEARHAGKNGGPRPLEGLPLAVKEEFRLAGTRRTSASLIFRDRVDDETDVYIQRLLDAGAIPHCKTTTPEFCLPGSTVSRLFGVTRNPWNPALSPGGSSGGSGAALAGGAATLASGGDIGGSIRIPAAACGVFGFKPPYGRNPELPVFNLDYYSHSGPMARSATDCALMQNVTAGRDPRDNASLRERVRLETEAPADIRGWKIAFSVDLGIYKVDSEVEKNTRAALRIFQDLGAAVEEVSLGWPKNAAIVAERRLAQLSGTEIARLARDRGGDMTEYAREVARIHEAGRADDIYEADETAAKMCESFGPMMEKFNCFVCPALAVPAPPAGYAFPDLDIVVNGETRAASEDEWCMTTPFNMLSRCPVLSAPSGFAQNGAPTGVQIVGRAYHDEDVIRAGRAYESALDWLFAPGFRPHPEAKNRAPANNAR